MRYVEMRVTPREGTAFHPLGERLAEDSDVIRGAIHQLDLLADGTAVMLAEARGDQDR
uniref:hypothetical protein n=1 Tax=Halomicrobium urmianum TaxID=1586233 RepID=UPI001CDA4DC6|nr:hypothetical protein [Halomicrobium urmianum]